ncbi:tRNA pseudouridine(38-40) synthase TruA [Marinospirillum sp. MEB164]|uniref:tRNA pseudouridine synthase A n=1 Tax=Marinospirillum alkalitolerans TaxID=3123374 RepID=A0ABW8PXH5_9GAMM
MSFFTQPSERPLPAGRFALAVEYQGSAYHGWQTQQGVPSVQPLLEKALTLVAQEPISVMCAGRTDAGVHASAQVVHFDSPVARSERAWVRGGNNALPPDIRVLWARSVPEHFHARHSALARRYRYVLHNHINRPAGLHNLVAWCHDALDVEKMQAAADLLVGEKDFSCFRSAKCQSRIAWRHMHFVRVYRRGYWIIVDIQANAFLHHMVRNIVGTLMKIGTGERPIEWVQTLLEAKQRAQAGMTAPAEGLYLIGALYPERYQLPQGPLGPHFMTLLADEDPDAPYPEFLPSWHRSDLTRSQSDLYVARHHPEALR